MNYDRFKKAIFWLSLMGVFALPVAATFTMPVFAQGRYRSYERERHDNDRWSRRQRHDNDNWRRSNEYRYRYYRYPNQNRFGYYDRYGRFHRTGYYGNRIYLRRYYY